VAARDCFIFLFLIKENNTRDERYRPSADGLDKIVLIKEFGRCSLTGLSFISNNNKN